MKILVIGSGGREHALAWKLARSPRVQKVCVAPGNPGTAREPGTRERGHHGHSRPDRLRPQGADRPDRGRPRGAARRRCRGRLPCRRPAIFGPTRLAAQLESSKDFAKQFMQRHKIPTARYQTFSDSAAAHAYVDAEGAPIVIKADGLAAGKGVVVAMTLEEAHAAIDAMLTHNTLGVQYDERGPRVVIEEFMDGEEASFIVMADGRHALPLATSQDHKRLKDADLGPNTGGMGAYSPAPVVTPEVHARAMREVIMPTLAGMSAEGLPYTGFLYAGLMIDAKGAPRVVEFNCRMGDPETQPIMMRLKSDLVDLVEAAIAGKLDKIEAEWDRRFALGVVMAAAGYPDSPRKGDAIHGLPAVAADDAHVFHAGTTEVDGEIRTSGGRVLCVTALGDNVKSAQKRAYELVDQIHFDGMQCRRDIGYRAVGRKG
jgi:phosphoribosylamine--glycine ligase